mmetsp:Transcript_66760/g.92882  ORF Transcript_66760/g.92882 Transcript_66760/m.92882 type:complete len:327 (+) Transcript_66760:239-1219(+)
MVIDGKRWNVRHRVPRPCDSPQIHFPAEHHIKCIVKSFVANPGRLEIVGQTHAVASKLQHVHTNGCHGSAQRMSREEDGAMLSAWNAAVVNEDSPKLCLYAGPHSPEAVEDLTAIALLHWELVTPKESIVQSVRKRLGASDGQDAAELTFSGWLRYIACWCGAYMMGRIGCSSTAFQRIFVIATPAASISRTTPVAETASLAAVQPTILTHMQDGFPCDRFCHRHTLVVLRTDEPGRVGAFCWVSGLIFPAACISHAAPGTEATKLTTMSITILAAVLQRFLGPRRWPQPLFFGLLRHPFCTRHKHEGGISLAQFCLPHQPPSAQG